MLLYLKVKPNARLDRVEKSGDSWQFRIKAPAVDGKANEYLISYLAEILGIPKSKLLLKKGHTARIKCVEIQLDEVKVVEKLTIASEAST